MGTTYHVVVIGKNSSLSSSELQAQVENVFADVNSKMSNWDPDSEISRFNKSKTSDAVKISDDVLTVLTAAIDVHNQSDGKFDITLSPLIEHWGFGTRKPETPLPSDNEIAEAMQWVGQSSMLTINDADRTVTKQNPMVQINLSALAKGFGIDAAAEKLSGLGFDNYLVEVGGDLRTAGTNERGEAWRVGIEKPEPGLREVKKIVSINGLGMATSGDYRNFIQTNGKRYSHIIDPSSGRPITHLTTSVTVLAQSAMLADAWATALLAIGSKQGIQIADKNNVAAYFISRNPDLSSQEYVIDTSKAFDLLDKTH